MGQAAAATGSAAQTAVAASVRAVRAAAPARGQLDSSSHSPHYHQMMPTKSPTACCKSTVAAPADDGHLELEAGCCFLCIPS